MAKTAQPKKRITFSLEAPEDAAVFIAGDFNDWNETVLPMISRPGGKFEKIVLLAPGRYEYKFKVDGQWLCDPKNPDQCENPHGTMNSVLVVKKTK